jgi:hypothetical protein
MINAPDLIPPDRIQGAILVIRNQKVILDASLAELYGVETKLLIRAVRRNADRFPDDFMFQLSNQDVVALRIQFGSSNVGRGGRRYRPFAFTEHGILMLSSVLNSEQAVHVNISIMRAFVRMREMISTTKALVGRLDEMERRYDAQFKVVFNSIRKMIDDTTGQATGKKSKHKIGFGQK